MDRVAPITNTHALRWCRRSPGSKRGTMVEQYQSVPEKTAANFPQLLRADGNSSNKCMGLLTNFKMKMQQTELHPCHLIKVQVPVNCFVLKHHRYKKCGYESAPTRSERGRPYHKAFTLILASRLLQIGDYQGPNTDDVGYNVNKMAHTQVVGLDGLLQSGARGHPIACLNAF